MKNYVSEKIIMVICLFFFPAAHFLKEIVLGLLYLHSHGILHRDLTLANILLTEDMHCVSMTIWRGKMFWG